MAFKNLVVTNRELDGDLLRQRRDFYAIALAMILFHLAGGTMAEETTLSSLPVHLGKPSVLYWAAWVSFAYFWWRFWVLDPGGANRFVEEWQAQTKASNVYLRLCCRVARRDGVDPRIVRAYKSGRRPDFPKSKGAWVPTLVTDHRGANGTDLSGLRSAGKGYPDVSPSDLRIYKVARITAFFRAIVFERSASDLILPHVLGGVAVLISFWPEIEDAGRMINHCLAVSLFT